MRKLISFLMTALMIVSLAACGKNPADSSSSGAGASSDPGPVDGSYAAVSIENETNDYEKKLVPLDLIPGETTDGSLYYRSVVEDGEVCYEIQPEGEETMTIPVSSAIIYVVENPEDCKVVKVSFDYVVDGESEHVEQYRIFSLPDAGISVNGDGAGSEAAPADGATSADTSAAVEGDGSSPAGEADIPAQGTEMPDASADPAGSSAAD